MVIKYKDGWIFRSFNFIFDESVNKKFNKYIRYNKEKSEFYVGRFNPENSVFDIIFI